MEVVIAEASDPTVRHLTYTAKEGDLIPQTGDLLIMESQRHCKVVERQITYTGNTNRPIDRVEIRVVQPK